MRVLFLSKDDLNGHPEVTLNEDLQEYQHNTSSYVVPTVMAEELCGKELFCYYSNGTLLTKNPTRTYRKVWTIEPWMIKKIITE